MFRSVMCFKSIYYPCICMLSNSCDKMQNDYGQLLCNGNIFEKTEVDIAFFKNQNCKRLTEMDLKIS